MVRFAVPIERYRLMVRSRALMLDAFRWQLLLLLLVWLLDGAIGDSLNPARLSSHFQWIGRGWELRGVVIPGVFFSSFLTLAIATWHQRDRALRLLLLRPFGTARITKTVKRLVLGHLGPYGNVYTLEDRNYKSSWLGWVLAHAQDGFAIFSALLKQPILLARVNSERRYMKVGLALARRWRPSFQSFMSGGQAFTIRSSDAWWHMVINLLINSSDIVFIDLSHVGQGTTWEITQLEELQLLGKCIFVVQTGHENYATKLLGQILPTVRVSQLFVYDKRGKFTDGRAFDAALAEHVKAALSAWNTPKAGPRPDRATAPTARMNQLNASSASTPSAPS
jgi:hypothetical protein